MTKHELPKAYDFKSTEPRIYEMWEKGELPPIELAGIERDAQAARDLAAA